MYNRAFGWVQNPSDFNKLKKTVQIFNPDSSHYHNLRDNLINEKITFFDDIRDHLQNKLDNRDFSFTYLELVGTSKDKNNRSPRVRSEAQANALIQISCLPQNYRTTGKAYIDNWSSDGFLRWAVSLNFINHNRDTDEFCITPLGVEFSNSTDDSIEEREILKNALLSYPPATQVLKVLSENTSGCTKFFIGNQLGFIGEKGFTSYDETLMIDWLIRSTNSKRTDIRSKIEGTSDKYARMIAGWLRKIGLVTSESVRLNNLDESFTSFQHYFITAEGEHALRQTNNNARNPKYIMWEFLAVHGENRDYIRTRRAYIIKTLERTRSFNVLMNELKNLGFNDNEQVIIGDITRLNTFGLRINHNRNHVHLRDSINNFSIPNLNVTSILVNREMEELKARYMETTGLPLKFIELLEIAFDNNRSLDFELITMELFRESYGLDSLHLGGGRRPDGIVQTNDFGIIIDTKAYSNGYSIGINQADSMIRYIEDNNIRSNTRNPVSWWENFNPAIPVNNFYFLWISGRFVGQYQTHLDYTSNETGVSGGVLNVEQMLIGADKVMKGEINTYDISNYLNNQEVFFN